MQIYLIGPVGRAIILVLAIFGFVLALGGVLDAYDAYWMFTVPLTVVYGALIWRFALAPADGEFTPTGGWALAVYHVLRLVMTIALLLVTLGVVALGYDVFLLVVHNWHYVVVALVIVMLIVGWAMLPERESTRRRRAGDSRNGPPRVGELTDPPGSDDLVS
jgi:hypothetical protein